MGACRKKPAQPASGTLSWMTPSETLLRLCLGGFGDMKWAWGGGWRLPAFLCQTTSSPGFCPISRAHFRDRKTLRKRVHHKGPPLFCCYSNFRITETGPTGSPKELVPADHMEISMLHMRHSRPLDRSQSNLNRTSPAPAQPFLSLHRSASRNLGSPAIFAFSAILH